MIQKRFRIAAAAHLFGDLAATALAFFGAWALRFELEVVPLTKNAPDLGRYIELLPVALSSSSRSSSTSTASTASASIERAWTRPSR